MRHVAKPGVPVEYLFPGTRYQLLRMFLTVAAVVFVNKFIKLHKEQASLNIYI